MYRQDTVMSKFSSFWGQARESIIRDSLRRSEASIFYRCGTVDTQGGLFALILTSAEAAVT